ncbi:MAG: extracellular solute-binding protein [Clostridiales bacterium]|jgi:putative aldouronate transport system substrate-binding protein|nr:extracellular solute-binding protein [Clostridiales bacterium]
MMKKAAAALSAALGISMLISACGGSAGNPSTQAAQTAQATEAQAAQTAEPQATEAQADQATEAQAAEPQATQAEPPAAEGAGLNPLGTYPITNEKVTLDIFFTRDTPPANWEVETNWFTSYYEELTNVKVNFEMVIGDTAQRAQKVNLKLASGQYPDVFSKCTMTRSQQAMYGSQGVFIPLNGLIETQTVNIKKMLEEMPNAASEITTPDGNIYGIPDVVLFRHGTAANKMWMNKTFLGALNLAEPETTEEFYQALKAIKEQDPNGNGIADEVPLVSQGLDIAFLMGSFVYLDPYYTMLEDRQIKFTPALDEYREGLRYIGKLVSEGLYAADSLTMDRTQRTALAMGDPPVVGAATALWPGHFLTVDAPVYQEGSRFWEYEAIKPLAGPTGLRQTVYSGESILNGGAEFNITSACKNPEVAIRWLDYFFALDGSNTASYGPKITDESELVEGIAGWRDAADGEVGADGNKALFFPYGLNNEVNVGWQTGQVVPRYQSFEQHTGMVVPADGHYEQMLYDVTMTDYLPYRAEKTVPPLYMDDKVSSEFGELNTMLVEYAKEATAQFISGVRDIETGWDAYIGELKSFGLDRFLEIYQQEYEKNYK